MFFYYGVDVLTACFTGLLHGFILRLFFTAFFHGELGELNEATRVDCI